MQPSTCGQVPRSESAADSLKSQFARTATSSSRPCSCSAPRQSRRGGVPACGSVLAREAGNSLKPGSALQLFQPPDLVVLRRPFRRRTPRRASPRWRRAENPGSFSCFAVASTRWRDTELGVTPKALPAAVTVNCEAPPTGVPPELLVGSQPERARQGASACVTTIRDNLISYRKMSIVQARRASVLHSFSSSYLLSPGGSFLFDRPPTILKGVTRLLRRY